MLKKLKNKAGMTLMEMMASLLIMVLLILAMRTGMNTGVQVYNDAAFESHSATLAANINTALTDILRYAQDVKDPTPPQFPPNAAQDYEFVFTNLEYGLRDAYFTVSDGILQIRSENNGFQPKALVNSGSYDKLTIKDDSFSVTYYPEGSTGELTTLENTITITSGGFFYICYTLTGPDGQTRDAEAIVRLMSN